MYVGALAYLIRLVIALVACLLWLLFCVVLVVVVVFLFLFIWGRFVRQFVWVSSVCLYVYMGLCFVALFVFVRRCCDVVGVPYLDVTCF